MAYSQQSSAIEAALADLRARRRVIDEERKALDEAIVALEKLLPPQSSPETGEKRQGSLQPVIVPIIRPSSQVSVPIANSVRGMTIPDAAKEIVRRAGRPLTNREIADALERAGFEHQSGDFVNTVGSILKRYEQSHADLRRVEGRWYLP